MNFILFTLIILIIVNLVFFHSDLFYKTEYFEDLGKLETKCLNTFFDPCPTRNFIQKELLYISDKLSENNLRYKKMQDTLDDIEEEVNILKSNSNESDQEFEKSAQIRKQSADTAKSSTVDASSKPASQMSGVSEKKSKEALNEHYSKPVSANDLDHFSKNQDPPSLDKVKEHNEKMGELHDQKKINDVDGATTSNNYINSNKVRCDCSNKEKGNNILQTFSKKISKMKQTKSCKDKCIKTKIGNEFKETCQLAGCDPINPMGVYPSEIEKMNSKTKKIRPKGYHFPS